MTGNHRIVYLFVVGCQIKPVVLVERIDIVLQTACRRNGFLQRTLLSFFRMHEISQDDDLRRFSGRESLLFPLRLCLLLKRFDALRRCRHEVLQGRIAVVQFSRGKLLQIIPEDVLDSAAVPFQDICMKFIKGIAVLAGAS